MGRSIGVEVGGSVTGCRSSGRILLQKARNKDKNAYHSVGRMGGGGVIWTLSMISLMVGNKR